MIPWLPGIPRRAGPGRLLVAALLVAALLGPAACKSPPDRTRPGDGSGLDAEQVNGLIQVELSRFREEMGQRYATFVMGKQLTNKQSSLESELRGLKGRIDRGEIDRLDGLAAAVAEVRKEFLQLSSRIEADNQPIRNRLQKVEGELKGERTRREVLDEELNAAYAEIHALREEMLGILGELQGYREAYRQIIELRAQSLREEQRLLDRADRKGGEAGDGGVGGG